MSQIYTVEDVARQLDVSVKTVRRYIYSGKIAANKIGGQWRISQPQIDEYITGIASSSACCNSTIDKDDFCVFMDTDYFNSGDKLQLCTIVDYYADKTEDIVKMSEILSRVVTEDGVNGGKAQFNYVYDDVLGRARFVLWGTATFIEKASKLLRKFEGDKYE